MPKAPRRCSTCPRVTTNLRRGLCGGCYQRERRGSPAAAPDASCVVCGLTDGRMLRAVQLGAELAVCCHNHGWLAERERPKPSSVAELVTMCRAEGDRRGAVDRRNGGDRRNVSERRLDLSDRRMFGPRAGQGDRRELAEGRRSTDAA